MLKKNSDMHIYIHEYIHRIIYKYIHIYIQQYMSHFVVMRMLASTRSQSTLSSHIYIYIYIYTDTLAKYCFYKKNEMHVICFQKIIEKKI